MALLEISRADKGYGPKWDRTEVLADINLEVERGEFIAIVGFSGAGKITLVNLLSGLVFPDKGRVIFDDKPVAGPERGLVLNIARPRSRQDINHNPDFKRIRNEVIAYLLKSNDSHKTELTKKLVLPDVLPEDLDQPRSLMGKRRPRRRSGQMTEVVEVSL